MLDVKTASVRQIQHHLSEVLSWVEDGEEVVITRHNRAIAKIVPAGEEKPIEWPDFISRAERIWGKHPAGKPLSEVIFEDREQRS